MDKALTTKERLKIAEAKNKFYKKEMAQLKKGNTERALTSEEWIKVIFTVIMAAFASMLIYGIAEYYVAPLILIKNVPIIGTLPLNVQQALITVGFFIFGLISGYISKKYFARK